MTTRTTINSVTFITNGASYYAINETIDGKPKTKPVSREIYEARLAAAQAAVPSTPAEPKDNPTDENKGKDAPAEPKTKKKAKGHATADKFLALIPKDTYIFRTNNKGHILIIKADGDKTAYARIRPLKDGAWIFPGKELKATREDWEYHKGWANEYALKVANWDEVAKVLNLA